MIENIGSADQKIPDFVALWILNFRIPHKLFQRAQKQEQQAYDNQWQIQCYLCIVLLLQYPEFASILIVVDGNNKLLLWNLRKSRLSQWIGLQQARNQW